MSGLLFRWDPVDGVLRSVGDPPHGLVGVVDFYIGEPPDEHPLADAQRLAIVVDGRVPIPPATPGRPGIVYGQFPESTPVSYDDAVTACAGRDELNTLGRMVIGMAQTAFGHASMRLDTDWAQAAVDAIGAYRDAALRRVAEEGWT